MVSWNIRFFFFKRKRLFRVYIINCTSITTFHVMTRYYRNAMRPMQMYLINRKYKQSPVASDSPRFLLGDNNKIPYIPHRCPWKSCDGDGLSPQRRALFFSFLFFFFFFFLRWYIPFRILLNSDLPNKNVGALPSHCISLSSIR